MATLRMRVRPEKRDGFLKAVRVMLEPTRVEQGCTSFYFCQDIEDDNTFTLVEEWENSADFDKHIRRDSYKKLLALMELLTGPPEIKINKVSKIAGLEYIEDVLLKSK
jgi:quinol monooxygenase YgiN